MSSFYIGLYNAAAGVFVLYGLIGLAVIRLLTKNELVYRLHLGELFLGLFLLGSLLMIVGAVAAFRITWLDHHATPQS